MVHGNSTGSANPPTVPSIFTKPVSMPAAGKRSRSLPTGSCRATASPSMSTSPMSGRRIPNRRRCRTISIRSVPTCALLPFRRPGPAARSLFISARSSRPFISGSTGRWRATARMPRPRRNGISPNTSGPAKTRSPSRSIAGRTAPISNARISGASAVSSAMSFCTAPRRRASAIFGPGLISIPSTGTASSRSMWNCSAWKLRKREISTSSKRP